MRFASISFAAGMFIAVATSARAANALHVAVNGADGGGCGSKTTPCRSISQAMANAIDGDRIIVGPGRYGDLDLSGTPGDSVGEEIPDAFYGNRVAVNAQPDFCGVVQKNDFVGSRDDCALQNLSNATGLDVTDNYWGAATGPGPDPATASAISSVRRRPCRMRRRRSP